MSTSTLAPPGAPADASPNRAPSFEAVAARPSHASEPIRPTHATVSSAALRERAARRRRWSLVAAWCVALCLLSALVWAISWFRPAQPAALVLLGAGYEENLAVPHNVYGWQSLIDLANHGELAPSWEHDLLRVAQPPRELQRGTDWHALIELPRAENVVVFISAHGAADSEGGYILPSDTTGASGDRLRLAALIDQMSHLPSNTRKLLVLDVTQIAGDWRLGILHNEFARALLELEPQIRAIPHLVVLCGSDVDQQSAVCDEWRRTVFAHYFLEALRGSASDADGNRRVNVDELQQTVDAKIKDWTVAHRGIAQNTLLLPHGEEGQRRARRIELAVVDRNFQPEVSQMAESFTPSTELLDAWQQYEQTLTVLPAALGKHPGLWREYEATLLRHEELVRAGDDAHAAVLRQRLSTILQRLTDDALPAPASLQNSLAIYTLSGDQELPQAEASQLVGALWDADEGDQAKTWSAALAAHPNDVAAEHLLRIAIYTQLVERASENPAANLSRAAQIAALVASPLHPLPAEVQFVAMLARYLPAAALGDEGGALVGRAITLKCLAERAAIADTGDVSPLSPEVAPWIAADIVVADAQRRLGEDLLFASSADRQQADAYFTAAEQTYRQALARAQLVQQAIMTRNRVFAQLPYYGEWLATQSLAEDDARFRATLDRVEKLWLDTHALAATLAAGDSTTIDRAALPTVDQPQPQSLIERERIVAQQFNTLVEQYHNCVKAIASGAVAADWHAAQPALRVPHGDWRSRMKLIANKRDAMRQMLASDEQPSTSAAAPESSVRHVIDANVRAKAVAYGQGRIALAALGRQYFAESQTDMRESFDQVRHRLDVFQVEAAWWNSTIAAGEQIELRFSELPVRIDTPIKRLPDATPAQARQSLALTARLLRQIDGAQAARLLTSPSLIACRVQMSTLATMLAQRTLADRWYDLDPQAEPYFRRAGLLYLSDAQQLYPQSPAANTTRSALLNAVGLELLPPARLDVTTERQLQLSLSLIAAAPAGAPAISNGFPVTWFESGTGLQLISPPAGERLVRKLDGATTGGVIPFSIDSPLVDAAEQNPPSGPRTAASELMVHGFFRGQVLSANIPVTLHLRPEITVEQPPLPEAAAVSLAAPASVQAQFGDGSGSVAIVLDASGSMGPPRRSGSSNTSQGTNNNRSNAAASKYAEATAALAEVLSQLPAGTKVSLWMFGQAMPAAPTPTSPEATIEQVQTPVVWNPSDAAQLAALMAKIDPAKITPWNESPIVRTILAAKTDLLDAQGFKTIVVITDGMDNRFAQDRVANPDRRSISETLAAAFEGSGISLNIVGFKVVSAEEEHARQQFEIVAKLFPPGRFYRVSQAEALSQTLRLALRQRLRFTLTGYDNEPAPAPLELGNLDGNDVWPATPIMPGTYRLQTNLGRPLSADVTLARGDVLALALEPSAGGFDIERRGYAASHYPGCPSAASNGWRATLLQNQLLPGPELRAALAVEQPRDENTTRLVQITPRNIWFDVAPAFTSSDPFASNDTPQPSITWQRLLGWPMPVWSVHAATWPLAASDGSAASPQIRVWWNPDATLPLAASINRSDGRPQATELTGVVLQAANETVSIASLTFEDHYVAGRNGQRTQQPCFVVRLEHSPRKAYWAELSGMQTAGVERRFYPSVGKTTCLFWPTSADEVERMLAGIGIVSLDDFQRDAERRGLQIELSNLSSPDANEILPTPAYSLE